MKQYIVIGLGNFGASVAKTLVDKGYNVLAIDKNKEKVQELANTVTHAVEADATDEEVLKTLGVRNFDLAVVSIGNNIHANVLTTLLLKELGVSYVIVKAQDNLHGNLLSKVGADRIIYPERDMGVRIAHNLISSNVMDYLEFSPNYSIIELPVTANMVGKNLAELKIGSQYNLNLVAIKRKGEINISVRNDISFSSGDIMVVFGSNNDLKELQNSI
ncbi:TrkA family potassium uptake protein [Halocella sp. SP3-1]|uniref:potassium channel family protein n=1 Tax=Halocella sp. SP3-1 TaxID=2382161 RepID=UPI000F761F68|nr:TrkA family potassium uptake protein [Halocella sp. SP3-1]AZO95427.1 TrkA family potassium uptake protein [Halocella sp. SP3-1]